MKLSPTPFNPRRAGERLEQFDFAGLFRRECLWGDYMLRHKMSASSFAGLEEARAVEVCSGGDIPPRAERQKNFQRANRFVATVVIFTDRTRTLSLWLWPCKNHLGKRSCAEAVWTRGMPQETGLKMLARLHGNLAALCGE